MRLRQGGQDDLSITFYRVDDLNGTINGLHPGDPGYQAAVQGRAYQMTTGGTSIDGPGYGGYEQTGLSHVTRATWSPCSSPTTPTATPTRPSPRPTRWSTAQPVGHLWNYGLNTWGWEDTYGGATATTTT